MGDAHIVVPILEGEELTIWDSKESEFSLGLEYRQTLRYVRDMPTLMQLLTSSFVQRVRPDQRPRLDSHARQPVHPRRRLRAPDRAALPATCDALQRDPSMGHLLEDRHVHDDPSSHQRLHLACAGHPARGRRASHVHVWTEDAVDSRRDRAGEFVRACREAQWSFG